MHDTHPETHVAGKQCKLQPNGRKTPNTRGPAGKERPMQGGGADGEVLETEATDALQARVTLWHIPKV